MMILDGCLVSFDSSGWWSLVRCAGAFKKVVSWFSDVLTPWSDKLSCKQPQKQ